MQPFGVIVQHRAPVLLHTFGRFSQMHHPVAEFANDPSAFLFTHLVKAVEDFFDLPHDRRLNVGIPGVARGIECSRDAEDCIQVRSR